MDETISLPLLDVESEHGALIVDKALDKVPGIKRHKVELNNKRAVIQTEDPLEVVRQTVAAIRSLGYGVETIKKNFPVTGLSCVSCAGSVESRLKSQAGIINAAVNYANSTASLEYVPTVVHTEDLRKAIQSIGYDLIVADHDEAAESLGALKESHENLLLRRAILSIAFSLPLVAIGMFFMDIPYANYIMWGLATPVVLIFGRQFFVNAWKQTRHRSANMDTLIAMSTGIAYLFSVFNTLCPGFWHRRGLHAHVYFEAAAVVIAFILLGKVLEERAKGNTSAAIKKLIGLQSRTVTIIHHDGNQMEIAISGVMVGDILLAKPGEKIAVDGAVVEGSSFVDESMLSGEPTPIGKLAGAPVYSGTINQKGSLRYRAEKVGGDTILAHIIKAVQEAQGSKAPVQKLADRIAGVFVPVVIGIAVLSLIAWLMFGGENGFTHGLLAMVTVLVIACPCALGLATPTAIMVGIGKGAAQGILIKDAESLQKTYRLDSIILDKTGTITEGRPEVIDVFWGEPAIIAELAPVLYGLEAQSEHPLAEAISRHFAAKQTDKVSIEAFASTTGKGVAGQYSGIRYFAGSRKFIEAQRATLPDVLQRQAEAWLSQAATVIWFGSDRQALAVVAIADKVRENSSKAIRRLKELRITSYMLTGDNAQTAKAVAEQAGIKNYKAELLPGDKGAFIKKLQSEGHVVAMVGDGINDSQALALADVSIAMGKGSDIAMDVAKMTLISSDLMDVPKAIALSGKTVRVIRQNLFWAFIYNVIGIPIAAGALYPVNGFLLNPMIAGAAMALSSICVITNSLRLRWGRL